MPYEKIAVDKVGDVAILRLDDPAALNAVSLDMIDEINHALDAQVQTSRALILTGSGRAFCAGANLGGGLSTVGDDGLTDTGASLESHINPLMTRLRGLPIPWVSAVRGPAAGVGCSLAVAADIVIASETAYFLQAFVRIGLVPDGGSSWLLTRAVGRARAMEMMLLGERLPAAQALAWGLINRVVADGELDDAALTMAQGLAAGPTRSLAMIRQVAWAAADMDWKQVLHHERMLQKDAGNTQDHAEGVLAFQEKRPARFTGA